MDAAGGNDYGRGMYKDRAGEEKDNVEDRVAIFDTVSFLNFCDPHVLTVIGDRYVYNTWCHV